MPRILVKFLQGYSRYNKGETAAFGAEEAEKLCGGKDPVAKPVGEVEEARQEAVIGKLDTSGVQHFVEQARSELDGRAAELKAEAEILNEKAAELARREAELAEREQALIEKPEAKTDDGKADDGKTGGGEPPKQGAKK